jgi:hypothetical protein
MGLWGYYSRWGSQILLQVFEGLLCLLSPLELAQGSCAPHQLLDIMEALRRLHLGDGRHLL